MARVLYLACILYFIVFVSASSDDSKQCKGSHEIYIDCPAGQCNPKTCQELVTPSGCPRIIPPCPGGCVCEDGYLRDKNGKCIPKSQCSPKCTGANEVYECRSKYQWEDCADRFNSPPFNPGTAADEVCRCYCKRDTWRYNGKCVSAQNCPQ
ncbi:venom serine protease inhibitor-like [Leguminivora glycinivorella]|uniref:venom serine protease inhibitor-like n=1 Tax=Leguminivora glycinivorella TaxID=1035111 RepID=UPI00200E2320|nr:venom serine protease inhibitor-like [Leguminivora glycinivorella]